MVLAWGGQYIGAALEHTEDMCTLWPMYPAPRASYMQATTSFRHMKNKGNDVFQTRPQVGKHSNGEGIIKKGRKRERGEGAGEEEKERKRIL